jgi:uncharacterized protein (TIGR02246 family)
MRVRNRFGLLAACAAAATAVHVLSGGTPPAAAEEPAAKAPAGGQRAQAFITAFERGDAKAVAGFWTPDGDYVDAVGKRTAGRAAIEKLYEGLFAEMKGAKLSVTVTAARPVGADVLLEDGISEVRPADGGPGSVSRFSAVLAKRDGEWYFESLRESIAHPPSNADNFGDLERLIGDWTGEAEKGESGKASYSWAENKNFIVSSFATTVNGVPVVGGTQWIGWDAGGGVGEASWKKDGTGWVTTVTARTADGKKVSATNRLTWTGPDNITWQLGDITVDGKVMPNAPPLKLKRVKP